MKKMLLLLAIHFSLLTIHSFAQPDQWNWYFGNNAALNFSSGSPLAVPNSAMDINEGCATVSDTAGNLLFYTNGGKVWDRNNNEMPNGFDLFGDYPYNQGTTTQGALIIPKPDSAGIYYIFTTDYMGEPHGMCYTEVDMSLNGGMGDITVKNAQLIAPACEKLCGIKHCNNHDYWVIAHGYLNNIYYAYLVNAAGVQPPVLTNIGSVIATISNTMGYLKASPNGTRIGAVNSGIYSVQLFDFDASTGMMSNCISIAVDSGHEYYGCSFSPNGTVFYVTSDYPGSYLYQYDITSNNAATIAASRYLVNYTMNWGYHDALQLGPDHKLYCTRQGHFIDAINFPDHLGASCGYDSMAVDLGNGYCDLGLPNMMDAYSSILTLPHSSFTVDTLQGCKPLMVFFTNTSTNATSYWWHFSEGGTSTLTNPPHSYSHSGTYSITLVAYLTTACGVFTDTSVQTFYFTVFLPPTLPVITQHGDTLTSSFNASYASYQWFKNSVSVNGATNQSFIMTGNGCYYVEVTDTNGCKSKSDSICTETGIYEIMAQNSFSIYPNPNNGTFTFHSQLSTLHAEFTITDVLGQEVYTTIINDANNDKTFRIPLANGMYFLTITIGDKRYNRKLMVNHSY